MSYNLRPLLRSLLVGLSLLLGLSTCRPTPPAATGYTVDGEITGIAGWVYLTLFEGEAPRRIDSAAVVNGAFHFTGEQDIPIIASIEVAGGPLVRFVLDNHPIRIAGAANAPAAIQVGGAPDQSVLTAYQRLCDSLDSLPHPTDSLPTLNPYRMDSIDRHIDSLKLHFVRSHSTSVVSAYALYRDLAYLRSSKELHQLYTGFTPEVRQTPYAQQILRMAQALDKTAIGQPYRDLSLPDTLGAPLPLSTLVGEGRYTLLYFWASWCTPCYTDLPVLARTHRIFRSRGFQIYAISLDRRHKTWTETLRNQNLRWNHVCDLKGWHSPALADYGVRSIPYNILIGPDGQIIARNLWGDDLLWKVSEYLGSPYRQDSTQQNQIAPLDGETSSGGIETAADSTVHE